MGSLLVLHLGSRFNCLNDPPPILYETSLLRFPQSGRWVVLDAKMDGTTNVEQKMVQFLLQIKAELENLTNFQPQGGCNDPNFSYYFKLKCGNCGEVSQKESSVTLSEMVQLPKSRGQAHLVQKCKFCSREGSVLIITGRGRPYTIEDSESQSFVPLMLFDIRGYEPVEFVFKDGWQAESTSGTKYNDINFLEGDFVEYDEKGGCPVGISELEHNFVVTK